MHMHMPNGITLPALDTQAFSGRWVRCHAPCLVNRWLPLHGRPPPPNEAEQFIVPALFETCFKPDWRRQMYCKIFIPIKGSKICLNCVRITSWLRLSSTRFWRKMTCQMN